MTVAQRKGWEGEVGIINLLHLWYEDGNPSKEFLKRMRSEGSNDKGDITGVMHTMIECKNSKASVSTLLTNAQFKARNAGRPMWWLTFKLPRVGVANSWNWGAMTTPEGLIQGYQPVINAQGDILSLDDIERLCEDEEDIVAEIGAGHSHAKRSNFPWRIHLIFRNFRQNAEQYRNDLVNQVGFDTDDRIVPIVIHPRIGHEPKDWFAYTKTIGMARMLETVGSLPEQTHEYVSDDADDKTEIPAVEVPESTKPLIEGE